VSYPCPVFRRRKTVLNGAKIKDQKMQSPKDVYKTKRSLLKKKTKKIITLNQRV
jgi:hypothetical protein